MRNRLLKSFTALAACCMMLAMAAPSFAQYGSRDYARTNAERLVRQTEMHMNQFAVALDRALDKSRLDGSIREDRINERASVLQGQLSAIRQELNRTRNFVDVRSQVASAINTAQGLNNTLRIRRVNFGFGVERQWAMVSADLNRLASIFNLRQLN
jgi:ribosomal protein L19